MTPKPWDIQGEARRALEGIVQDPHYGAAALSKPTVMSNLLKDLLPDQPREAGLLVAAAHADLAGTLRRYADQGLDMGTATKLTVRFFTDSTSHTPEACSWVVAEIAQALGFERPVMASEPGMVAASVTREQPLPTARLEREVPETRDLTPPHTTGKQAQPAQPAQPAQAARPIGDRPISAGAALAGCAAVYFLLLACIAPYVQFSGVRSQSIFTGYPGDPGSETFWLALEPVAVLLIALGSTMLLFAPKRLPRLSRLLPGMLVAFGIQTILLFAAYAFAAFPPARHEAGGFAGMVGGAALLAAGLASQRSGGPRTADGTAGDAASARRRLIITLTTAGGIAILASILWLAGVAPGFLNAGSATGVGGHHVLRGAAAAVGGIVAFAGAWILSRRRALSAAGPAGVRTAPP